MKKRAVVSKKEEASNWVVKYETHGEIFEFTFRRDGTGNCRDVDFGTDMEFAWDAENTLQGLQDSVEIRGALEGLADEIFWSEINNELGEEAIITDEDMEESSEDVEFSSGSEQELERLTRLTLYAFPSIWADGSEDRKVRFSAEGKHTGSVGAVQDDPYDLDLGTDIDEHDRSRVTELLNFALGQNTPVGENLEYNDGPSHRWSGYSWCANSVQFEVCRPSFHEIAEARSELRDRLRAHLSSADLDRLLPVS